MLLTKSDLENRKTNPVFKELSAKYPKCSWLFLVWCLTSLENLMKIHSPGFNLGPHQHQLVLSWIHVSSHLSICPSPSTLLLQFFERYLCQWPFSANFVHSMELWTLCMIGLSQVWGKMKYEEITWQPEIWWSDAVYQEADHYLKWPRSAKVHIFWSRLAKGAVVLWTSCSIMLLTHRLSWK